MHDVRRSVLLGPTRIARTIVPFSKFGKPTLSIGTMTKSTGDAVITSTTRLPSGNGERRFNVWSWSLLLTTTATTSSPRVRVNP